MHRPSSSMDNGCLSVLEPIEFQLTADACDAWRGLSCQLGTN